MTHLDQLFSSQQIIRRTLIYTNSPVTFGFLPHTSVYRQFDSPTVAVVHDMVAAPFS